MDPAPRANDDAGVCPLLGMRGQWFIPDNINLLYTLLVEHIHGSLYPSKKRKAEHTATSTLSGPTVGGISPPLRSRTILALRQI